MAGKKRSDTMNTMTINGCNAVITYDEEIDMFRGEFIGLTGGADFYATDIASLRTEGEISLRIFLDACQARGIEPRKHYSGKFNLRVPPALHERLAVQAAAHGKSINAWVLGLLEDQGSTQAY
jgi:predicted HicB family RNase H-like nuclease